MAPKPGTLKRAKMAAASLGLNLSGVARASGCTLPHLRNFLLGTKRASPPMAESIKAAFGHTWPFVVGQVDELKVVA
jgi:hypothetical protein